MMPEDFESSDEKYEQPPAFFAETEFNELPEEITEPIEVRVEGIYMAEVENQTHHYVRLTDGDEKLMISIGGPEAKAILDSLDSEVPDRPMTHDLLRNVIDRLGATVDRIVIDDLWHNVFYAKIYLLKGKEEHEIDARPSDAIAVAVRFQAPIFVQSKVFQMAHND
jgi:uncharacterized protein